MKSEKLKLKKGNKAFSVLRRCGEIVSDCVYPKKCVVCNCFTPIGQYEALCSDCRKIMRKRSATVIEPDSFFEEATGALPYKSHTRNSMIKFKFRNHKYLGKTFGFCIHEIINGRDFAGEGFIICPVPIHPLRDREYNQSAVVARYLSDELGIDVYEDMLIKIKNISPLSTMGYALRRASVSGSVEFNLKYDVFGKNILLIDDIYTSGSTVNECAGVLRMHGAAIVVVLTACHNEQTGDESYGDATDIGN